MQGIEPKFHSSLIERMKYYRYLLSEMHNEADLQSSEIISQTSELDELYDDYLMNKKKLENSIKNYRQYHLDLRKLVTARLRELKRKVR
ncbi:hypothetical protein MUU74_11030 [Chryseobacterium daecheongense]|uniref:hypothetical protein n=1 Tax=Chryseobacterium daecheongense TaxID=192389 RepID=UPI001FD6EC03|nr:hypothetical protein [Chryseobacterium daecheongense]UOU97027.1 hypothetical protein MUU74_11030 [Chryseobacterium daecheongense]